jgi:murein DD-endopeptidase MepM/ murein hydrolase activator NlpD
MADTLRPGEPLGDLFRRHGIVEGDLLVVVSLLGLDPRRVPTGWTIRFGHPPDDSTATTVTVRSSRDQEARLERGGRRWSIERVPIAWRSRAVRVSGRIGESLEEAMIAAAADTNLSEEQRVRLAWDVADVFAWEIDFTRDLQAGDRIAVLVEVETSERGETDIGAILASEIELGRRRRYAAFRFELPDGRVEYYDEEGRSLRRAFLRAPLEFRRISSRFSGARFHPILRVQRAHVGIDYAAAVGTPVRSAGDGILKTVEWSGDLGRLVEVRHRNDIVTRYAHLSAFGRGLLPGARVFQGDVVGYVGASGLATAPHLHYEFRQNGIARDPSRADLGEGDPVPEGSAEAYRLVRDRLRSLLRGTAPPPTHSTGSVQ